MSFDSPRRIEHVFAAQISTLKHSRGIQQQKLYFYLKFSVFLFVVDFFTEKLIIFTAFQQILAQLHKPLPLLPPARARFGSIRDPATTADG